MDRGIVSHRLPKAPVPAMRLEYWGVMIVWSWSTVWAFGFGLCVSFEALGRRRGRRRIMCRRLGSDSHTDLRPGAVQPGV